MTRWPSVSARFSTACTSFLTMRPTGMPVQSPTTAATACSSTLGRISGVSPWSAVSSACSAACSSRRASARPPIRRRSPASAAFRRVAYLRAARAQRQHLVDQRLLGLPACLQPAERFLSASSAARAEASRAAVSMPIARLARDDLQLGLQRLDAPAAVVHLRRHRVLADRHSRARGVEQAHRLVRQLARRDVAVRQPHRRLDRLVQDLHPVVLLQRRGHRRASSGSPSSSSGSSTCTT